MFTQQIKEQRRQLLLGEEMTDTQKNQLTLEGEAVTDSDSVPTLADPTVSDTAETPFEAEIEEETQES